MEVALGSAASLLGKVLTTLSDGLVAAYVDSLQLGHNSEQIRDKLLQAQSLLHSAQGSHVRHNPGLQRLLEKLSRDADQAEDLLDEVHYFKIHDMLHGTHYATTQEARPDLDSVVRHQALHARSALRHTLGSLLQCFSCSPTQDGGDDAAVAGAPRCVTNSAFRADGDTLHFDRVSMSSKIKSLLQVRVDTVRSLTEPSFGPAAGGPDRTGPSSRAVLFSGTGPAATKPGPDRKDRTDRPTTTGVDVCGCSGEVGDVRE